MGTHARAHVTVAVMGWGYTRTSITVTDQLRQVDIGLNTDAQCSRDFPRDYERVGEWECPFANSSLA